MIVGFAGLAGSGKDTSSDILVRKHNFVKVALADPLKRICKEVFDFTDDQLWGPSASRNAPDARYVRMKRGALGTTYQGHDLPCTPSPPEDSYLTPRFALQRLGTEWGRDCYGNLWIDYALRVAKALLSDPDYDYLYTAKEGLHDRQPRSPGCSHTPSHVTVKRPYSGVAISDVRFKNEIDAIHAAGGMIIRMTRGEGLAGVAGEHRSETEQQGLDDELFDITIDNRDWSLEQLESYLDQISHHHFKKVTP